VSAPAPARVPVSRSQGRPRRSCANADGGPPGGRASPGGPAALLLPGPDVGGRPPRAVHALRRRHAPARRGTRRRPAAPGGRTHHRRARRVHFSRSRWSRTCTTRPATACAQGVGQGGALKVELRYDKSTILADYLSVVPTGYGLWSGSSCPRRCRIRAEPDGGRDLPHRGPGGGGERARPGGRRRASAELRLNHLADPVASYLGPGVCREGGTPR
jgi:hypothetical protein